MKITFLTITTLFIAFLMIPRNYEVSVSVRGEEVTPQSDSLAASPSPASSSRMEIEMKPVYEDTGKVSGIDVEALKSHICEVFGERCEEALEIATCESVHFTDFIGDEGLVYVENGIEYGRSYGPFQIRYLRGRPEPEQLLDPMFNVQFAKQMFDTQGWGPWTCKYRLASL